MLADLVRCCRRPQQGGNLSLLEELPHRCRSWGRACDGTEFVAGDVHQSQLLFYLVDFAFDTELQRDLSCEASGPIQRELHARAGY
jgi:hypothetical protein